MTHMTNVCLSGMSICMGLLLLTTPVGPAALALLLDDAPVAEPAADAQARCFELPPMCRGQAQPVCICGFYRTTCRWECSE